MTRALFLAVLLGCGVLAPAAVRACVACIEMPKDSVTDRAIDADAVVILREDPARPFRFAVARVIGGNIEGVPPAPFLVDTTTRARLASDPDLGALATWTWRHGWQFHGLASVALQGVIERALVASPGWFGATGGQERFAFFGPLHDSADEDVRMLALIELARMPYGMLRGIESRIGRREVAARLTDLQWAEWTSIQILLLGLRDDLANQAFVRRAAQLALARDGRRDLAAWTVAWIEVDGRAAIDAILRDHLCDPARPAEEVRAIALGLYEHVTADDPELSRPALDALRSGAVRCPAIAGIAARALTESRDWSGAEGLSGLLEAGAITEPAEAFVIENYIALDPKQPALESNRADTTQ